jgi:HlyD family secretion protein
MHQNLRRIIPILLILALIGAGGWYISQQPSFSSGVSTIWQKMSGQSITSDKTGTTGNLTASGSIEVTQVTLAPEVGGKVVEVLAEEGQTIRAGQILVRFSDSLLQAQLQQAQAQFKLAQANYDLVIAGPLAEQRRSAIASAEVEVIGAQQARDDLDEKIALIRAKALDTIAAADKALDKANERLDSITSAADQTDIDAAQATVTLAKDRLDKANQDYEPYKKKPEDNLVRAMLLSKQAAAQSAYDAAVHRLNNFLGTANSYDLALAKADKNLAQAQLDDARQQYEKVKAGPDPDSIALAEARLAAAQARLVAARADPTTQQQVNVAKAQIEIAQAAIDVLKAQIEKLALKAPSEGVVLSRSVEPGETVLPGANLLTIARLDRLKITVYITEDRYGAINLSQTALVSADSFPGVTFKATVNYIADKAEFTPRNVQTAEGRRTTVFAVRLVVENQDGKLKPGMPVDVTFGN